MAKPRKTVDIRLEWRSQNSTRTLTRENRLKSRSSWYICISPLHEKCDFSSERVCSGSAISLNVHQNPTNQAICLASVDSLKMLNYIKKPFVFISDTGWHSLKAIHNFCQNMFRKYEQLQLVTPLENHKLNHGIEFSRVIKHNQIGSQHQTGPHSYRSSFNPV